MRVSYFQSTTLIAVAMLLLILFVSAGYMLLIPEAAVTDSSQHLSAELQQNRELWERSRPASFRYVVDRSCSCALEISTPYVASEARGYKQVAFRTQIEAGDGEFLTQPPEPAWIDDIFDEIAEAIASDAESGIEIRYDEQFGFPAIASIRYPMRGADITYEIQDFEVLEYRGE